MAGPRDANSTGETLEALQAELIDAARQQDEYDLSTINLIAPATPTPYEHCDALPLRHNAIAEGLLNERPYAGVEGFNRIERVAVQAACLLFNAEHANVQPHSVSQANQAVYQALLNHGDKVLAMRFDAGGHLTHGMRRNFSGQTYNFDFYGLDRAGFIDYDEVEEKAAEHQPKMIVCGGSSYPHTIEFDKLGKTADAVGAYLVADLSHPAGLIAANRFPKPFPDCDIVTLTADKTLLGPHGGIILCKQELSEQVDAAVHPGVQSSVPLRRIYGIGKSLLDANTPWFRDYIDRLLNNMDSFEEVLKDYPGLMVSGGSSTHLMVLDTYNTFRITGKDAEFLLESVGILTNRQTIPGETLKPYVASGIRIGTSWITARGYSTDESKLIAKSIVSILENPTDTDLKTRVKIDLSALLKVERQKDVWYGE